MLLQTVFFQCIWPSILTPLHCVFGMLTKLENLMTINEPFNLVIFALKVKFINIDLVTMNFHTYMTRLKRPHANFRACQFQIQSNNNTPCVDKSIFLSAFAWSLTIIFSLYLKFFPFCLLCVCLASSKRVFKSHVPTTYYSCQYSCCLFATQVLLSIR